MKPRAKIGIGAFVLTTGVMMPGLFFLSRNAVTASQMLLILIAVLSLVLWTVAYVALVDPRLRKVVGDAFGLTIQWRGPSNSISWTPTEKTGCITGLLIDLLGYFFIFLWLAPLIATEALVVWLRR
jgi:hypothetical protein